MVNFARCKCLGANVLRGPNQIPWDGKLEYDYQLWIDSDIVFNSEKFFQLLQMQIQKEKRKEKLLQVGIVPKMVEPHRWHTGQKKMIFVAMVV